MQKQLILGSNSPRRKEILALGGYQFDVKVKETDESWPSQMDVKNVAQHIAIQKAVAIKPIISDSAVLLTADTTVILGQRILGKPSDEAHAFQMLSDLSGKTHLVNTAVVLTDQSRQESISIFTEVVLDPLTETEIRYYIKKYKPFDKAGAYAIQEWIGIQKIRSISGCYYNVVGLPLSNLSALLADFGIYPILE